MSCLSSQCATSRPNKMSPSAKEQKLNQISEMCKIDSNSLVIVESICYNQRSLLRERRGCRTGLGGNRGLLMARLGTRRGTRNSPEDQSSAQPGTPAHSNTLRCRCSRGDSAQRYRSGAGFGRSQRWVATVSLSTNAANATGAVYTVGFTATTGLANSYGTITLAAPSGTIWSRELLRLHPP